MSESSDIKREIEAIGQVIDALEGISGPSRERVIDYVVRALSIGVVFPSGHRSDSQSRESAEIPTDIAYESIEANAIVADVRALKESKQPRTAIEMAAIVAFYLGELAPDSERSEVIGKSELQKYFKQAGFPLPAKIDMVLVNAASAGYFDRAESGRYRLNPVGYNLVAHNLPSGSGDSSSSRRPKRRAAGPKKSSNAQKAPAKQVSKTRAPAKKSPAKKSPAKKAPAKKSPAKKAPNLSRAFKGDESAAAVDVS